MIASQKTKIKGNSILNLFIISKLVKLFRYSLNNLTIVLRVGIEPTLCCQNWILNPARLPVPPPKQADKNIKTFHLYSILLNNY